MITRVNIYRKSIKFEIKNYVWLNRRNIKITRFSNKLNDKNLKFYQIINKKNQIYELKLSNIMHIHSIFHFWLLRKNSRDSLSRQNNELFESIILNEKLEWKIDDIIDFRYYYHRFQYRVNWTNYSYDRVWYYVDNQKFVNAQNVINEYYRVHSNKFKSTLRNDN